MNKGNKFIDERIGLLLKHNIEICQNIDMMELNNKTIMITGASGLLGANFLASLLCLKAIYNFYLDFDFRVIGVVNSEQEDWYRELVSIGGFEIQQGDLGDINFVNSLPNADYIIHGATYSSPQKFTQDALKTIFLNTTVTDELIKKLNSDGKFLFISSSEVYSGNPESKYVETDIGTTSPLHHRACYIEGKRCGEAICKIHKENGKNIKVARLCLAYGIGIKQDDSRVLNDFISKGLDGEIRLRDDGSANRTYIYVSNAIEIMFKILFHGKDFIYNVGGKSETTIRGLASLIAQKLNTTVKYPNNNHTLVGSPDLVNLDMSKVENEFGDMDFLDLSLGLDATIKWIQTNKTKREE